MWVWWTAPQLLPRVSARCVCVCVYASSCAVYVYVVAADVYAVHYNWHRLAARKRFFLPSSSSSSSSFSLLLSLLLFRSFLRFIRISPPQLSPHRASSSSSSTIFGSTTDYGSRASETVVFSLKSRPLRRPAPCRGAPCRRNNIIVLELQDSSGVSSLSRRIVRRLTPALLNSCP